MSPQGTAPPAPAVRLRAPERVSLGSAFDVVVEVEAVGEAIDGQAELAFNPGLVQGQGSAPGRVTVSLVRRGASLVGSVSLRALAAGAGSASIEAVGGAIRRADGATTALRPVVS